MELSGSWRAAEADEDLRRAYPAPDFDDRDWQPIAVPGQWRSAPAFASSDGPLLLRHSFEHGALGDGERAWLTFEGVFYAADVWLDGSYVGDTEGYFAPHAFEVTDALRDRREHVLAVEVACPPQRDPSAKRSLTGAFQCSPWVDDAWNPGGIWRPVTVRRTGRVTIRSMRVVCLEATTERAVLACNASVDATDATDATLRTTVGVGTTHEDTQRLAAGENRVEWKVAVDAPTLWWPHALGSPELVDVVVALDVDGHESDRRSLRTGIREVRMRDWITSVNGERLFLKGTTVGPARPDLAAATTAEIEHDIVAAKEAGFDLVRVHAHVSRPELYDAADRHGMLLWQDLPLHGSYARTVRKQAVRQARQAVDLLAHHPSIVLWCAHDDPGAPAPLVPTWNKSVLDGSVHRALEKADPSRPAIAHADGSVNGERDIAALARAWPRAVRFVAFGEDADPHEIETLRRLKYRPCGGYTQHGFSDAACAPLIVVADRPAPSYRGGDAVALDVHVVSDLREPIVDAVVRARLTWPGGGAAWAWTGDAPADACVRAGIVRAVVPDDAAGALVLELEVEGPGVKAANRYESIIVTSR